MTFSSRQTKSRLRFIAWLLAILALIFAWGGTRLLSGWVAALGFLISGEQNHPAGAIYNLETALGILYWLSPFLLIIAALVFLLDELTVNPTKQSNSDKVSYKNLRWEKWLPVSLFLITLLIHLWPLLQANWPTQVADYDEGVHLLAARQLVLGYGTYDAYFFTQPPMAVYGSVPAALFGNGAEATVWLGRFTSVIWHTGGVMLVYTIGRKLVGWPGALVAAAVFGLDGWGVLIGHEVMLEFQLNFFCLLALWLYLKAEEPEANERWLWLSGLAASAAFLTKLNGVLILACLVIYLLARRHWLRAGKLVAAFIAGTVILALPLVYRNPDEFIKQVFIFQLSRGADGITGSNRFDIFNLSAEASLTLLCAWLGMLGLVIRLGRGKRLPPVTAAVAIWFGLSLIFFSFSRAFYLHYYISLLPSLALTAGGLPFLAREIRQFRLRLLRRLVIVFLAVFLGLGLAALVRTYGDSGYTPGPSALGQTVQAQTPAGATVFTMWGLDTFFSARPLPATAGGKILIDHYGAFYYNVYGLNRKNAFESAGQVLSGYNPGQADYRTIQENADSQQMLAELIARADYTAIGDFGRIYLSEETRQKLVAQSQAIEVSQARWFYRRL